MRRQLLVVPAVSLMLLSAGMAPGATLGSEDFGWTIVSGKTQCNMDYSSPQAIRELRHRYGDRFLAIRAGDERYLITDEALVRRGEEITNQIKDYQPDIGDMAQAEAKLSLSEQNHERKKAALKERRKEILAQIEDNERRGRPTEHLEQELFQATTELQAIRGLEQNTRLSSEERRRLERQRERASARVKVGTDKMDREMRELLDTAKSSEKAELLTEPGTE
jgi:hypothetical protein